MYTHHDHDHAWLISSVNHAYIWNVLVEAYGADDGGVGTGLDLVEVEVEVGQVLIRGAAAGGQ